MGLQEGTGRMMKKGTEDIARMAEDAVDSEIVVG
jgi:hypothetical protein